VAFAARTRTHAFEPIAMDPAPHRSARLRSEAHVMLSNLSFAECSALLVSSAGHSAIGTIGSKVSGVCQLSRSIAACSDRAAESVRRNGINSATAMVPAALSRATAKRLGGAHQVLDELLQMGVAERRHALTDILIAGAVTYFVAGGADVEGGLPGLDLIFGIGNHRNPFSHTILLVLSIEASLRFFAAAAAQLHGRLPESHDPIWDHALALYNRTYEAGIVGAWLGTAGHLLNDAGLPWAGVKPMVGLPITLSIAGHKAFLAGNSVAAAALGGLTFLGRRQYTVAGQ